MKHRILFSFLLFTVTFLTIRCNRTENIVPNTQYVIDSINITGLYAAYYSPNSLTIVNNGDNWQRGIPSMWMSGINPTLRTIYSDTVQYRQIAYYDDDTTYPWFDFLLMKLKDNRLLVTHSEGNLIGRIGQDGVDIRDVWYSYNGSRLTTLKSLFVKNQGPAQGPYQTIEQFTPFDYTVDSVGFNYTGNTLHSIYNYTTRPYPYGSSYKNITFNYPTGGHPNQRDMIGLDVNDFILDYLLPSLCEVPLYRFPIGTQVMSSDISFESLNGISYNTHSDKLIEEIHYTSTFPFSSVDTIIRPVYTFDSLHNNRITEMQLFYLLNGAPPIYPMICKFYYRPD